MQTLTHALRTHRDLTEPLPVREGPERKLDRLLELRAVIDSLRIERGEALMRDAGIEPHLSSAP